MKAMVVYDSVFGNTEKLAQAMGQALSARHETRTIRVTGVTAETLAGLDLLVVGSPTRGFRPTEAMVAWLKALPAGALNGVKVAAFDTRVSLSDIGSPVGRWFVRTGGYAATNIAGALKKAGGELVAPAEGFYIQGETEAPLLKDGELERAATWVIQLM